MPICKLNKVKSKIFLNNRLIYNTNSETKKVFEFSRAPIGENIS